MRLFALRFSILAFLQAAPVPAATQYMLVGNGQSLSLGNTGCGAISTTQSWGNQTYNGSALVPLTETGACDNGALYNSSATYQPYAALSSGGPTPTYYQTLAQTSAAPPASPWTVVTTKESPLSSAINNASVLAPGFVGIAKNFGQGGASISSWCSSSSITNIANNVSAIKTLISPNTLVVIGVMVTAGETDFVNGSTTYYSDARNCQSSLETAIQAVTGQSQHVPWIYSQDSSMQVSAPYGYTCPDGAVTSCIDAYPVTSTASYVPIAQYQLARDFPSLFFLAGPKYQYNYGTNGSYHLSAQGYNMLGAIHARTISCLYAAAFGANSCTGGVAPKTPIYLSGNTVTLHVATPGGLPLDSPSNAISTANWTNGAIPYPYYGSTPTQHTSNMGFQFFQQVSGVSQEIQVTNVAVSGTTITLTLASAPTGTNLQLAYGFEAAHYAKPPSYGCAWNAPTLVCNGISVSGTAYSAGTPHGNIRTVQDTGYPSGQSINGDAMYHWMVHFIENVQPQAQQPSPAVKSGGVCSGCRF